MAGNPDIQKDHGITGRNINKMAGAPEKDKKAEFMDEIDWATNPVAGLEKLISKLPDDYKNYSKDKNAFVKLVDFLKTVDKLNEKELKTLRIKTISREGKETLIDTAVNMSKDLLSSGEFEDSYVFGLFKYYKSDEKFAKIIFKNAMERKPWFILREIKLPRNYGEEYTRKIIKDAVALAIRDDNQLKENAGALFQYSYLFSGESYAEKALMKAVILVPRMAFEHMNGFIEQPYAGKILTVAASREPLLAFDLYNKYDGMRWTKDVIKAAALADALTFFEYENVSKYEKEDFYPEVIKSLASSSDVNARIVLENFVKLPSGPYVPEIIDLVEKKFPMVLSDFPALKQLL